MSIPETRSFASAYGPSVTAFADPRTTVPPFSSGGGPTSAWPAFTSPPTHAAHFARWAPISAGGGGGCPTIPPPRNKNMNLRMMFVSFKTSTHEPPPRRTSPDEYHPAGYAEWVAETQRSDFGYIPR